MSAPKWTAGTWEAANMIHAKTGERLTPDEIAEYVANAVRLRPECTDFLFVSAEKPDGAVNICLIGNGPDGPHNAHLIAAAPEMYEALERIRYECDNDLSGLAKLFIDATLAKARGES